MSFYNNPNVTYNKWINWYHGVPETAPADPDPDPDPDPPADPVDVDFGQQETDVGGMDPAQEARVSASIMRIGDQRINGVVTKKGKNFAAIDFGTIKYASLDDYLKAEQLGDRSGRFSGVEFPDKDKRDKTLERAAQVGASLDPTALMLSAIPFASAFDSQVIQDPTGQFTRAIPKSGIFNPIATMAIAEEYRELYALKEFRTKNPGVTGKNGGFAFNFGNVNIWRRPGEVLYRGQLDRAGLNQQTATSYEQFINGASQGKQVVSAMLASSDGDDSGTAGIINSVSPDARLVLQTENGGYLLNGNFHYGSGIARYGFDDDMKALAASVFSAGGKLSAQESYSIAQKWRSSAHGLDRNATAAEKLANLQTFIDAATTLHQNNVAAAAAAEAAKVKREREEAIARTKADVAAANERLRQATESRRKAAEERAKQRRDEDSSDRDERREQRQRDYQSRGMSEKQARSASASASRYESMARSGRYNEGGEIPEDEDFVRGSPDSEEPMITGNELLEAAGDESGFVERPPSEVSDEKSVADDKPMVAKEEGMVLNAEAVKLAGEQDVAKMIKDAEDYVRGSGKEADGDDREATDIQISEGEVYISPQLADVIGRDRLRKINDRGKPKTEEKLKKAAKGGKVGYAVGDEVESFMNQPGEIPDTGEAPAMAADIPEADLALFTGYLSKKGRHQRSDVENLIDNLSERGRLALLMLTETTALADPLESMEAVGQVAVNRMNTNDPDFDEVTTLKDVLKQRSKGRGSGSKMFQFDGLEPTSVKDRLTEVMGGGAQAALDKIYSAADNVIDMNPRLGGEGADGREPAIPLGVLYYKKPGSQGGSFMDKRHYMEPYTTIGGHQFYNVNFEFPGRHSGR